MYVFEVTIPGTWLDYEDKDWAWRVEALLQHLQSHFHEANAALNLFETMQRRASPTFSREQWKVDADRHSEIRRAVEAELGEHDSFDSWDRISHESEVRFKREKWSNGSVPQELEAKTELIAGKAFIYALDGFDKFLRVLAAEPGSPVELKELAGRVDTMFPDLRGVRNTTQHLEDRSRGLGAGQKPKQMKLEPIESDAISAPEGGTLVLNTLSGNRLGCTKSDGHYGEVEISPSTMNTLSALLHEVLQSFKWSGPMRHAPSA